MSDPSVTLDAGPAAAQAPVGLYAFPARAWHRAEYAGLQASALGPSLTVVCEPGGELAWADSSVATLGRRYAEQLVQQEGARQRPLVLLGWSVGALVAIEVARRLAGRCTVAWVGSIDGSLFPALRQELQQLPPLPAAERAELEAVMRRWLQASPLRAAWSAALQQMGAAEHELFLRQVVAAYGHALPQDGPRPGSQEHALWSRLNCLRLGLGHVLPAGLPAPLRCWRSAEMASQPDGLHDAYAGHPGCSEPEVVAGSDHLGVLDSPLLHARLVAALSETAPPAGRQPA